MAERLPPSPTVRNFPMLPPFSVYFSLSSLISLPSSCHYRFHTHARIINLLFTSVTFSFNILRGIRSRLLWWCRNSIILVICFLSFSLSLLFPPCTNIKDVASCTPFTFSDGQLLLHIHSISVILIRFRAGIRPICTRYNCMRGIYNLMRLPCKRVRETQIGCMWNLVRTHYIREILCT